MSDLPNSWIEATLTNLSTIEMGQSPDSRSYNIEGKGLPFFQGKAEFQAVFPEIRKWCTEPTKVVERGDILLSIRAPVGPTNIAPEKSCIGRGLAGIRAETGVNQTYLYYFFKKIEPWLSEQGTGSTFAAISGQFVREISCPVAPAAEQTRIVAKLEELLSDLDAGVAELKAAQKKLAQYRQSLLKAAVEGTLTAEWRTKNTPTETGAQLLQRILTERRARWEGKQLAKFEEQGKTPPKDWQKKYPEPVQPDTTDLPELPEGWGWASLEQIASDERYSLSIGPFGSNLKVPDYRDSGVPLVFVRNIRSGNYGGEHTKYVTSEKAFELNAHSIAAGDVLVTKMGEPPGDADVYPSDQPPAVITADCIKIRCWPGLMEPALLKAVINSHIGKRQIEPMTQGVAQKKVSLGRFTSLAVPVPPTDEQALIVQTVSIADREALEQLAAINLSLKQSIAQRQNILRAAFAGQLVAQDPNDEPASVLLERIRVERSIQQMQPKIRNLKKSKRMNSSDAVSLRDWVEARAVDDFSFEDLRAGISGDYEALKDSVFQLLAADQPIIEQFFDTEAGMLRFRKVTR